MAKPISTVIFDLDGLLADTERLHFQAYQITLSEHGLPLMETEYCEHWVRSGKGIADWVAMQGLDLDPQALRLRKSELYADLLPSSLRPMEGALELLRGFYGQFKIALASSSYRDAIEGVVAGLGIASYFEAIVSGSDVLQVKPAPDIFLKAARALTVKPEECLVVEDAEKGVVAAYLAGMRCIAVPNDYTRHHDFSKASKICLSLNEITMEVLQSLEAVPIRYGNPCGNSAEAKKLPV
jgi:HAD superfamily hydrolase (TIGR01509 family)